MFTVVFELLPQNHVLKLKKFGVTIPTDLITDISATLIFVHHFNFRDIRTTEAVFGTDGILYPKL